MSDTAQTEARRCSGLVFIGDPHLSSKTAGRRTDKDFTATILGKIAWIIDYCNENDYVPVFLGDMFDDAIEVSESVKTRLIRILRKSKNLPVSNVGNHDMMNRVTLTDDDSLRLIEAAGLIRLCTESGVLETFEVSGKTIGLGATPYAQDFPVDARFYFPHADSIIWLTHHDLAFEGVYPGATELREIRGCKLAINGHMHLKKDVVMKGETRWLNPGNITRQATDAIEHVPAVRVLTSELKLKEVPIPYQKIVFDLTGKLIESISPGEVAKEGESQPTTIEEGAFVTLLQASTSMEMAKTDNGSILMEDILAKFDRDGTNAVVQNIVLAVHKRAMEAV